LGGKWNNFPSEGVGTVLFNCVLSNGSYNLIQLKPVLYIPSLGHTLISWNVLRAKGYVLIAGGQNAVVYHKDDLNVPVFMSKFLGNLPFVLAKPATEHSLVTVNMSSNDRVNKQRVNEQASNQTSKRSSKQVSNNQLIKNVRINKSQIRLMAMSINDVS